MNSMEIATFWKKLKIEQILTKVTPTYQARPVKL